jgi:hypothetical protein
VIEVWQARFNLKCPWAFEAAWTTLAMWDRFPDARDQLQWFAAPRARNLAEEGFSPFEFHILRQYYPSLDFHAFKQSIHGALEAALAEFGETVRAADITHHRQPIDLNRAFECLALRVCTGEDPNKISKRKEFSRDWTALFKGIKSAAVLIGLPSPGRGRPSKKLAQ